jgi:hypothetical protein
VERSLDFLLPPSMFILVLGPYPTIVVRFAEFFASFEDASDSLLPNLGSKCFIGEIAAVQWAKYRTLAEES